MTIEINGMAHVILTVSQFDAARAFYGRLLPEFGMKVVHDGDKLFYCVGARTAIGIEPCDPALAGERFVQQRVGLHHVCLRARSREDVDRCAALLLKEIGATIVRGPTNRASSSIRQCSSTLIVIASLLVGRLLTASTLRAYTYSVVAPGVLTPGATAIGQNVPGQ